jgi:hypothetical protein
MRPFLRFLSTAKAAQHPYLKKAAIGGIAVVGGTDSLSWHFIEFSMV